MTAVEIAALDALIAAQPDPASRAGMIANLVIEVLQQDGYLSENYDG